MAGVCTGLEPCSSSSTSSRMRICSLPPSEPTCPLVKVFWGQRSSVASESRAVWVVAPLVPAAALKVHDQKHAVAPVRASDARAEPRAAEREQRQAGRGARKGAHARARRVRRVDPLHERRQRGRERRERRRESSGRDGSGQGGRRSVAPVMRCEHGLERRPNRGAVGLVSQEEERFVRSGDCSSRMHVSAARSVALSVRPIAFAPKGLSNVDGHQRRLEKRQRRRGRRHRRTGRRTWRR